MGENQLEQKKAVAEWLGWKLIETGGFIEVYTGSEREYLDELNWNPQSDSQATFAEWQEIYDRMSHEETAKYYKSPHILGLDLITLKPSIRWKALIQMIKEGK